MLASSRDNQHHYWPAGGFRPALERRWIGDSTNYMEVIAYLVGFTVEYDFTAARSLSPDRSAEQHAEDENTLASLRNHLATLTGPDPQFIIADVGIVGQPAEFNRCDIQR